PGTPIDPQLLEARESVYLGAVCAQGETVGAAFLDISTGEFRATQATGRGAWERIVADIESYAPRELIFPQALGALVRSGFSTTPRTERLPLASSRPKASDSIAVGNAHGSSQGDAATLKESNTIAVGSSTPSGSEPFDTDDPGGSLRSRS